jgi:RimJ/RimL family protein N-acetyltransferase
MLEIEPVVLEGKYVRLEPLTLGHLDALCEVGDNDEIWRWNPYIQVGNREGIRTFVEFTLAEQAAGTALPFATIERVTGRVIGTTRFMTIDRPNRHVEIGGTWLGVAWQRTPINTEAKYLMFRHAFETWGCIRVELKTDSLNDRSHRAILRIGAKEEGTFRNHMITSTGRIRHSIYFSVIDSEWPEVKARLEARMSHG